MNNSVLDLLFGLLLSSSESYTSQIMSLHSSCSHKCHCLIRVLVGTTHKKYNLYNLAILQLLPFTTTKPMCVLCVHSSSSPLSLNIKILRFFLLLPYLLTSPSTWMTDIQNLTSLKMIPTISPAAFVLLSKEKSQVSRIRDLQNQCAFLPNLSLLVHSVLAQDVGNYLSWKALSLFLHSLFTYPLQPTGRGFCFFFQVSVPIHLFFPLSMP